MGSVEGERLLLVRHAMPEVRQGVPADRWRLGATGRAAARRLAPLVSRPASFVASTEPKTAETLREIAGPADVRCDAGFAEVRRARVWSDADSFRAEALAYLRGEPPEGWEAQDRVVRRFDAAVVRHAARAAAAGQTLVIGTHGLAATLWLSSTFGLPGAERFWAELRYPELIEIDLARCAVAVRREE